MNNIIYCGKYDDISINLKEMLSELKKMGNKKDGYKLFTYFLRDGDCILFIEKDIDVDLN